MLKPLILLFDKVVASGDLTLIDSQGVPHRFGDGSGEPIAVRFRDRRLEWHLAFDPELAAGVGYMEGRLVVEQGTIYDVLDLVARNLVAHPFPGYAQRLAALRKMLRRAQQINPVRRARRNVAHHYDIDPRIYELFLDPDRQYSCAYFPAPGTDLADAQLAKKRHIAAKLALAPGQKVLDIGCGWGGLSLYLARMARVSVTGITLSSEQIRIARDRASATPEGKDVRFELVDYREAEGEFDRIVSVGMFEHVGVPHYATFFSKMSRLLAPDGTALLHTIGRTDGPWATNPFIAEYIFPGGHLPALSEVMAAIEKSGLICTDVEVLRLHYAETLRGWRSRFLANRAEAVAIAGEEFCRMWEFYLAGSEVGFRYQNLVVFQIQLAKKVETLPITRDYMAVAERRLAIGTAEAPQDRVVELTRTGSA